MWLDAFRERATSRAPEMEGFLNYKKKIKDSKFKRKWFVVVNNELLSHEDPSTPHHLMKVG